jgi:hypothetical protein
MSTLPQFQDDSQPFQLMQNSWGAVLNPIINNPLNLGNILNGIVLASGDNTINHKLGRKLQGWYIVGQNASATFYDKQSTNSMPNLTLVLNASGAVTVNMVVF